MLSGMGDSRRHRGPHPRDRQLFSETEADKLRQAVTDLSWLRSRDYADPSAVKLVGDRYQLKQRQRVAVRRCACADAKRKSRRSCQIEASAVAGNPLSIDGLNVITTIEVALSHGVLLLGRDRCMRDMASFHGSYRFVVETERAVALLVGVVQSMQPSEATVYIDEPVSNSGRLAAMVRQTAEANGSSLEAITSHRVDETLAAFDGIVATADSAVLDECHSWVNLARLVVERHRDELEPMWLLDLS